jgi:hypothetical protein
VNVGGVEKTLLRMKKDKAISYILFNPIFKGNDGKNSRLYRDCKVISRFRRIQQSANGALWRLDRLKKYCRPGESIWEFEAYSRRRRGLFDRVYTYKNGESPININVNDLDGCGVTRGKIGYKTLELFRDYGIDVDLSNWEIWTKEEVDAIAKAYRSKVKEENAQPFWKKIKRKIKTSIENYKDDMPKEVRIFFSKVKHFGRIK